MVDVSCSCGRREAQIMCFEHAKGKKLECDDECLREQRNNTLFAAFNLGDSKTEGPLTLVSPELLAQRLAVDNTYTPEVLALYSKQPVWCTSIELIFSNLVLGKLSRNSHHFSPMKMVQRQFVHELADAYNVFSESQDPEPKRSVFVKTSKESRRPTLSLKESLTVMRQVKQVEEEKAKHQQLVYALSERQNSQPPEEREHYNALAIRDVFFGITRDKLEEATNDLWQDRTVLTKIQNCELKWIPDNTFVFYSDSYQEKSRVEEAELEILCDLFERRLKERNLAMRCCLARIDDTASIVYEFKGENNRERRTLKNDHDGYDDEAPSELQDEKPIDKSSFDWW
ncbi:hypothetical protein FOA43_000262 [Brettanomyces nanus]|uniref:R3H domain-containing protein n=1 Tax=Eeniella nana TaxID=13502 RepID=A0A875RWR3_EENNA|nr:uncharacterized protein FOA43_000262 [Brettanomyces nanus]QPG72958.1 hypothetical protein FOA43_000262 [Brettanomyces nanus]